MWLYTCLMGEEAQEGEGVSIEKNIAAIFMKENIIEYKITEDHISVDDFTMFTAMPVFTKC